jgi:hypothetical protein
MRALRNGLIGLAVAAVMAISVALVIRSLPDGDAASPPPAAKVPPPAQQPETGEKTPEPTPAPAPSTPPPAEDRIPQATAKAEPQPEQPAPPVPPFSTMQGRATELLAIPPAGVIGPQPASPSEPGAAAVAPDGRLNFSPAQEERVRYVLMSHNVMQTEAPDFPLQVGATVPDNVRLAPLPIEIADIVPNYRAYAYVISQNRIVIVTAERRTITSLISIEARG